MANKDAAEKLAERTADAYSADRYASWVSVCRLLLKRGYTERQAEAILRSKWTRWASDVSDRPYGKIPAKVVANFLDKMPNLKKEVADLTRETFEASHANS